MNAKRIRKYFIPVVLSFACVLSGCSSNVTIDNQNNTEKKEKKFNFRRYMESKRFPGYN